jgi:hypothetical protein
MQIVLNSNGKNILTWVVFLCLFFTNVSAQTDTTQKDTISIESVRAASLAKFTKTGYAFGLEAKPAI